MEKTVTLRFYDVRRTSADKPMMGDLIERIAGLAMTDRERHVTGEAILVRLEDFDAEDGEFSGQFVRGQSGNLPGRMLPDGTDDLPFDEPLGYGVAFRYRSHDGLLAIQYDPRVLSPSRVMGYLYAHDARAEYLLRPRYRDDAWQRFDELPVRKVEIAVAGRPNVADLDDGADPVWQNVSRMKDQYGADTVRIQLSMGHRGGALREGIKTVIHEAMRRNENGVDDIRAIKGVIDNGNGIPNEELDLMGELFDVKEDLAFPDRDVAQFYRLRRNLLRDRLRLL